jgi:hypothetical protein
MHAGRLVLLDTPEEFLKSKEEHARAYLETLKLQVEAEINGGGA